MRQNYFRKPFPRLSRMRPLDDTHLPQKLHISYAQQSSSQRRHRLDRTEAEHHHIRLRMSRVILPGKRLRAVFNHQDSFLFRELDHRSHRHARAEEMRHHNRPRPFRNRGFDFRYLGSHSPAFDVQRNRNESVMPRDIHHLFDRQRRHQNLTACL